MSSRPGVSIGNVLLMLACIALLALRVPIAAQPAMWIDEAFSLYHAHGSFANLWTEGWRLESSPPLYYSVLWAWIRLVGDGEFAARLLSLALSAGSTAFVYAAARTLGGRIAGAIAALTWLLPALEFEYSIEIRPYALQHLCIAAAIYAFARVLVESRSGRLRNPRAVAEALAPIVLAATASFYTHTTSFAFIVGLAASAALYGLATRAGRGYMLALTSACVVTAGLCLPQALAALEVAGSNRAGLAWMPSTFDLRQQSYLWRMFALGQMYWSTVLSLPLALAVHGTFALAAWRMRSSREVLAISVGVSAIGVVSMLMAGALQSVLLPRTVLWLWLPMTVLVGCAAATVNRRAAWPWMLAVGFTVLFAATSYDYVRLRESQRPWVGVLSELGDRVKSGDRIVMLDPEIGCLLDRYAVGPLREAPRGRLELGEAQRFRSGQRLDIGCNRLPEVGPVSFEPPAATWVLTADTLQRADLDDVLVNGSNGGIVSDTIERGGRVFATRIAPPPAFGATGWCRRPKDAPASKADRPGSRP